MIALSGLVLFLTVMAFMYPAVIRDGAAEGILLCGRVLIPSLFPFMVLTGFIVKSGADRIISVPFGFLFHRLFRVPKALGAPVLLGLIGGYPVGAHLISERVKTGELDVKTARRAACFTVGAGPAFIINAVGSSMLGSAKAGVLIFAASLLSSITLGFFSRFFSRSEKSLPVKNRGGSGISDSFVLSASEACTSVLTVTGFVVLFSALISLIKLAGLPFYAAKLLPFLSEAEAGSLIFSFLEVVTGCAHSSSSRFPLELTAFALGFGGLSVHCQILALLKDINLKYAVFFLARLMGAALTVIFLKILLLLFPVSVTVSGGKTVPVPELSKGSIPLFAVLILLCIVFLMSLPSGALTKREDVC